MPIFLHFRSVLEQLAVGHLLHRFGRVGRVKFLLGNRQNLSDRARPSGATPPDLSDCLRCQHSVEPCDTRTKAPGFTCRPSIRRSKKRV